MRWLFLLLLPLPLVSCGKKTGVSVVPTAPVPPGQALVWSPTEPSHTAAAGEVSARFTFTVKNVAPYEVVILDVKPSCGCTTAEMPGKPWRLKPGETNKLETVMDIRDKMGPVSSPGVYYKDIQIIGTNFTNDLKFSVAVPPGLTNNLSAEAIARLWGQQLAAVDHQAVFKTDCVKCHLVPAFGKTGEYLFHTSCGICHEAKQRASVVPDLSALKTEIDTNYWRNWITYGKPGTLMPGFTATLGGPLDDEQINSLVAYLSGAYPRPIKAAATNSAK